MPKFHWHRKCRDKNHGSAKRESTTKERRILKEGESQLPDGRYRYRYFDMDGCRQVVYSWKLVERDRMPPGKKDDLSLREKERQIERDMEDSIKTGVMPKSHYNSDV